MLLYFIDKTNDQFLGPLIEFCRIEVESGEGDRGIKEEKDEKSGNGQRQHKTENRKS